MSNLSKKILWINPVTTELYNQIFKEEYEKVKQSDTIVDVVSLKPAPGPINYQKNVLII